MHAELLRKAALYYFCTKSSKKFVQLFFLIPQKSDIFVMRGGNRIACGAEEPLIKPSLVTEKLPFEAKVPRAGTMTYQR